MIYEIDEDTKIEFDKKLEKFISKKEKKLKKKNNNFTITKNINEYNNILNIIIETTKYESWNDSCLYKFNYEKITQNKKYCILIHKFKSMYFIQINGNLRSLINFLNENSVNTYNITPLQSMTYHNFENFDKFLNESCFSELTGEQQIKIKEKINLDQNEIIKIDFIDYFYKIMKIDIKTIIKNVFSYNHENENHYIKDVCDKNENLENIDDRKLYIVKEKKDGEDWVEIADIYNRDLKMFINIKKIYKIRNKGRNIIKNISGISELMCQSICGYKKYLENFDEVNYKLKNKDYINEYTFCIIKNKELELSYKLKYYLGITTYNLMKLNPNIKINLTFIDIDKLWIQGFIKNYNKK